MNNMVTLVLMVLFISQLSKHTKDKNAVQEFHRMVGSRNVIELELIL